MAAELIRGEGRAKRFAKSPPVLLRATSRVECVREMGRGEAGDLTALERRTFDGLVVV